MRRVHRAALSSLAIAGLAATAVLPMASSASAATVQSRSDAAAVSGSLGGQGLDSGRVTAESVDGQQQVSGNPTPSIPTGGLANVGVLTQQAAAGNGSASACAGLAGNGGGIVQLGNGSCLNPGNAVQASFGSAEIPDLTAQLPEQVPAPITDILGQGAGALTPLTDALNSAIAAARTQFGDAGLYAELAAVEGRCTVDGSGARGSATLAGARVVLKFPDATGQEDFVIASLPVNPAPNTTVPTQTSQVVDAIAAAVATNFRDSLGGNVSPVAGVTSAVLDQLAAGIRDNIEEQLAPIEQNLLKITLNEQVPGAGSIRVTALHAEVLPAVRQALGAPAGELRIGDVGCGPLTNVAAAVQPTPEAAAPAAPATIPTAVSAGKAGQEQGPGVASYAALALGVAAVGATGVAAARRRSL